MKTIQSTTRWLGLVLACGIITFAASAQAGKPVRPPKPPPVDTGVIYAYVGEDVYAVSPDGSGQQYLFSAGSDIWDLAPSRSLHSGQRWFLGWQRVEGVYPDGSIRQQLIAVNESGEVVPLADDPTLQPAPYYGDPSLRWLSGDGQVSWLACRWDGDTVVELGLYTLDIDFSSGVPVAVGAPTLLDWTANLFPTIEYAPGKFDLSVGGYDWSPDGTAIVYTSEGDLYLADANSGSVLLTSDVHYEPPQWSPDGTRVAFRASIQRIDVINIDGSGRQTLVENKNDKRFSGVYCPVWSPASTHLAYGYRPSSAWKLTTSLQVIAADGTGDVTLTSASYTRPIGWCAEQ